MPRWKKNLLVRIIRFLNFDIPWRWYRTLPVVAAALLSGVAVLAFLLVVTPQGLILIFLFHTVSEDYSQHGGPATIRSWSAEFAASAGYIVIAWFGGRSLLMHHSAAILRFAKQHKTFLTLLPLFCLTLVAFSTMSGTPYHWLVFVPIVTAFSLNWPAAVSFYAWKLDELLLQKVLARDLNPFRDPRKNIAIRLAVAIGMMAGAGVIFDTKYPGYTPALVSFAIRQTTALILVVLAIIQACHIFSESSEGVKPWGKVAQLEIAYGPIENGWSLIHWSDLHLTSDLDTNRLSGAGPGGNAELERTIRENEQRLRQAKLVLLTGDMTDGGTAEEWGAFINLMPPWLLDKTIMLPGNHDVNITNPHQLLEVETGEFVLRRLRLIRMMAALDLVQGTRAYVWTNEGDLLPLRERLGSLGAALSRYATNPMGITRGPASYTGWTSLLQSPHLEREPTLDVEAAWASMFPMILPLPETDIKIVLIDSNELGVNILDNAFGHVSRESIQRLRKLLDHFATEPLILALHHHVAIPKFDLSPLTAVQIQLMVLRNARDLLAVLAEDRSLVVFHGHLHIGYKLRINGTIEVVSAPSTTLGDERCHTPPCFSEYWFERKGFNGVKILSQVEVGAVQQNYAPQSLHNRQS
jgi:hypothetical protein